MTIFFLLGKSQGCHRLFVPFPSGVNNTSPAVLKTAGLLRTDQN